MGTKSFHTSNFGMFANNLPKDKDGFIYLTIKGWVSAGYEIGRARELKQESIQACKDAQVEIHNFYS